MKGMSTESVFWLLIAIVVVFIAIATLIYFTTSGTSSTNNTSNCNIDLQKYCIKKFLQGENPSSSNIEAECPTRVPASPTNDQMKEICKSVGISP